MIIHCFIFTMRKYIAYSNIIVSGMKLLESLKKIDKEISIAITIFVISIPVQLIE